MEKILCRGIINSSSFLYNLIDYFPIKESGKGLNTEISKN